MSEEQGPKNKVGVYICHCGGNISDVVDVEAVRQYAKSLEGVEVAQKTMFMCSSDGQDLIEDDLKEGRVDSIVVGACSPKLHETTFRGAISRADSNPFMLEQANIREQVSWTHTHDKQAATIKAMNLVAAAAGKAGLLEPLTPIKVQTVQQGIVVGGGVAGLRASLDLAQSGLPVLLLEKGPFLGGRMAQLGRVFPNNAQAREVLTGLIDQVVDHPNITIHTNSQPISGSGSLGDYTLQVQKMSRGCEEAFTMAQLEELTGALPASIPSEHDHSLRNRKVIWMPYEGCWPSIPAVDWENLDQKSLAGFVHPAFELEPKKEVFEVRGGSVILATGFDPYQPAEGEYGFGQFPEVITLPQLIRMMDTEGPTGGQLKVNDHSVRSVAFIHCVGSRQQEGLNDPSSEGGRLNEYCSRSCCTATLQATNELRELYPDLHIYDLYQDIRTYGRGHEEYYTQASKGGILFFRYEPDGLPKVEAGDDGHPLKVTVKDGLTDGEELEMGVDLVVLSVGMVPRQIEALVDMFKLPLGSDGFLQEVHPKLRPVELAVEGLMIAGTCQGPMDITESTAAASAAASKARAILSKEHVELNPYIANVNTEVCQGSGQCVTECSEVQAISLVTNEGPEGPHQIAEINHTLCNGCGMCVAVCPHDALDIQGWTIPQYKIMVQRMLAQEVVQ